MYMHNKTIHVLFKQMVTSASTTCMVTLAAAFSTCMQWMCIFRGFPDTFDCEVIFRRHNTRTLGTRNIRLEKYDWATSRENLGTHFCIFIWLWEFCVQVRLKLAYIVQKLERVLKFWIQQVYILYYIYLNMEQQIRWSDCADAQYMRLCCSHSL